MRGRLLLRLLLVEEQLLRGRLLLRRLTLQQQLLKLLLLLQLLLLLCRLCHCRLLLRLLRLLRLLLLPLALAPLARVVLARAQGVAPAPLGPPLRLAALLGEDALQTRLEAVEAAHGAATGGGGKPAKGSASAGAE